MMKERFCVKLEPYDSFESETIRDKCGRTVRNVILDNYFGPMGTWCHDKLDIKSEPESFDEEDHRMFRPVASKTTVKRLKMISSQEVSSEDTPDFEPQASSTQNSSDANNGVLVEQEQNIAVEEPAAEIIQPDDEVLEQNIGAEEPVRKNDPNDNDVDPGDRTLHLTPEIVSEMPGFDDVLESFHSVSTTCPKFQNKTKHFTFKIKETVNPLETIQKAFGKVLEFGKRKARAHDKVGVTLRNNNDDRKPIYISFRRADQINAEVLFQQIEAVIQSDETFLALGPHHLKLTTVEAIDGRGRIRNRVANTNDMSRFKKSIVTINNDDNLCLPRALVTGIALLEKDKLPEKKKAYRNLRDGRPA
ncbi:hypothetical protein V9T40_011385 [Parthenolecanium corni]|uniref:Uncharacterized protein n=1 Tax=Parthenolecanium corni TaxID=536013 RepID=A0AAN9T8W5_9HEMI